MVRIALPWVVLALGLSGCARPPQRLAGESPPLSVAEAQRGGVAAT
jgi:hypothetical protein